MAEDQKGKSGKKRKRVAETEDSESIPPQTSTTAPQKGGKPKKPKKPKKDRQRREQDKDEGESPQIEDPKEDAPQEDPENSVKKQQRFIVFIGNLPYTSTTDAISKHFSKLTPASVRHQTNKETGQSRGFAFLEFEGYDRMKTCLKLYHHSNFDDGLSPARKINVELTAGGGGSKSKHRKTKLREKNLKLSQERSRAARGVPKDKNVPQTAEEHAPNTQEDSMHPSRRTRVRTR